MAAAWTTERWPGQFAVGGGAAWMCGLLALAITDDVDHIAVRLLLGLAGILASAGLWHLAAGFSSRIARVGCRIASGAALAVGGGLAIGTFFGFILAYFGLLFVTPAAFLILAFGLLRSHVAMWVKTIPWVLALAGTLLYGFHAVAREIWDPHDAFWLAIVGFGWLLLGFAGRTFNRETNALLRPLETPAPH